MKRITAILTVLIMLVTTMSYAQNAPENAPINGITLSSEYLAVAEHSAGNDIIDAFDTCVDIYNNNIERISNLAEQDRHLEIAKLVEKAGTLHIKTPDSSGSISVSAVDFTEYIEYAVLNAAETKKLFAISKPTSLGITLEFTRNASTCSLVLPQNVSALAMHEGFDILRITTPTSGIEMPFGVFANLSQNNNNITFEIQQVNGNKLDNYMAFVVGNNTVYSVRLFSETLGFDNELPVGCKFIYKNNSISSDKLYTLSINGDGTIDKQAPTDLAIHDNTAFFSIGGLRHFYEEKNNVSGTGWDGNDSVGSSKPTDNTQDINDNIVFSDVPDNYWGKPFIDKLTKMGILEGMGNGLFEPEGEVTREQFAKMLVEAFDLTDDSATCSFKDVPEAEWFYKYIASANKTGIVYGLELDIFGTGENIKRMDMATMAVRAMTVLQRDIQQVLQPSLFEDDTEIEDYAKEAVKIMQQANIIVGVGGNRFSPNEPATRAAAAKIICMLIEQ